MDPYIEQLNAEMADVNIQIGKMWMALAGIHPDDPGYSGVCNFRHFNMVSCGFQVILHGFWHFYPFLLFSGSSHTEAVGILQSTSGER